MDEEKRLDRELAELEAEEKAQEIELQELAKYQQTIENEETKYWQEFN